MFEWNKYFPFHNQFSKEALKKADPKEVETYVNRVMESVFGSDYAAQFPFRDPLPKKEQPAKPDAKPDIDIFETADHVFVKVPISESQLEQLKIKHTSHALMIENFPNLGHPKKINLPCLVKRKGTKAVYKDGLLEVMFQKQQDYNMSEVEIIR
ncbi:Hsp20/alpha crystallin family protein [Bacillus spizizenii ATCC 6633 = JCM 2499]|uniref:Component of the spore coat n=1 Tax=Bacillus spizizenii (strain ATCC 23059 / NRRL B-14472 / W23) TaxID=655816 RepID=E0TZP5_BACSH|nr:Hsp20/alpha crystallin family protein [Bacillus spizizenii]MDU7577321.1 Hsp20/alpha crystallin family protein [Bacillus subtilis]ADM38124.1 component of the spore coat [Bacillus spizizenii str. W23]AJW83727.1 spore gernimation protein GerT [Bacillus spizizenii]EFG93220.1 component of the spore coat [Bacillus spizizenii ATCC 6633 = JCM 2499]KFK79005.1 spore germination protein gerT [Bacillus spizizenii]